MLKMIKEGTTEGLKSLKKELADINIIGLYSISLVTNEESP